MATLYVLQLENDKWYIGKTTRDLSDRYFEHLTGAGSSWTQKYRPIDLHLAIKDVDEFEEDKQTKIFMKQYGINNVRGGSYTEFILPEYQLMALRKELSTANDTCFKCGSKDHYAYQCNVKNMRVDKYNETNCCYRCGRDSHWANNCFAKTNVYGNSIN